MPSGAHQKQFQQQLRCSLQLTLWLTLEDFQENQPIRVRRNSPISLGLQSTPGRIRSRFWWCCKTLSGEGHLFLNSKHRPWTAWSVDCRFKKLEEKIGRKVCAYDFRKTFASRMMAQGMDALTLSAIMGHESLEMLKRHYVSFQDEHLLKELNKNSSAK